MQLSTHTHKVTDQFFRAITPTHTECRVILQMIFFSTCIKMGDNAQKIDTFDLNRARKLWLYTTFAAFLFAVRAFFFVKFVCLFVGFVYVSVLLFYLVYDLHLFVLVTLSRTLLNLCCMICCLFVFFLFSLSHDLIIIGIINNITSLRSRGQICTSSYCFLHTLLEGFWISVFPSKWETWWTQPFYPPGGWDTMVNETGTKQWTKHPHKHTHTHTTIAHTDNQKIQNTPPALIEQFLALFIDNKLELLEFKGGLVQF